MLQHQNGLSNHLVAELKRANQLHNTIVAAYKQSAVETEEIKTLEMEFQALMSNLSNKEEDHEKHNDCDASDKSPAMEQ